ncbi:MAG: ABC transporter ATP-binding protein [Clostridia bacterium]|nr:ABC transporter ATP-binding protein [Clostridia bacterium]
MHFDDSELLRQERNFISYYADGNKKSIVLLLKLYNGHYLKLFFSAIFFLIKDSPALAIPLVTSYVINLVTNPSADTLPKLVFALVGLSLLIAINLPTHYIHTKLFSLARRSVEAGLRGAMVRKLQQLSISFHKEMQSGRIQSKVMRDVEAIEALSSQMFTSVFGTITNLVFSLGVILFTNWLVFIFFLFCTPVAAFIVVAFRKKMSDSNKDFRKGVEQTSANILDMVELIPVTRAHALEENEIKKFTSQLNTVAEKGYRLDIIQQVFGASSWIVFQIFQLLCLGVTSYMAYKGDISIGEVALYQTYFSNIVSRISALVGLLPTISKGTESLVSVGEILSANDIEDNTGKKKLKTLEGEFEFKNVNFSYTPEKQILNNFNLKVNKGETIALVGESGAGKSTVLNMVIGFNKATSGEILIDGNKISEIDLRSYRRHIAVVPQTSVLFSGTIRDNITYGLPTVTKKQLDDAINAANLKAFIASLPDGLDTIVGEHGGKLSGGQRQRISIARAIIRNPKVIILDEATSALDSVSEKEIQDAIDNLTRERTTFIVAHRLSTIRNADKIAVMRDGHCTEHGTFDELMALKGEFYKMKILQS